VRPFLLSGYRVPDPEDRKDVIRDMRSGWRFGHDFPGFSQGPPGKSKRPPETTGWPTLY